MIGLLAFGKRFGLIPTNSLRGTVHTVRKETLLNFIDKIDKESRTHIITFHTAEG